MARRRRTASRPDPGAWAHGAGGDVWVGPPWVPISCGQISTGERGRMQGGIERHFDPSCQGTTLVSTPKARPPQQNLLASGSPWAQPLAGRQAAARAALQPPRPACSGRAFLRSGMAVVRRLLRSRPSLVGDLGPRGIRARSVRLAGRTASRFPVDRRTRAPSVLALRSALSLLLLASLSRQFLASLFPSMLSRTTGHDDSCVSGRADTGASTHVPYPTPPGRESLAIFRRTPGGSVMPRGRRSQPGARRCGAEARQRARVAGAS